MFSRSAIHASRSAKAYTTLPSILSNVNLNPVAATASTRVRRHSSSKASCPPGGSQPSAQAPEAVRPTSRLSRRRNKDTSDFSNTKARDGAFADLPAVPMTDNVAPEAVTMASFFSLHRPISLIHPIPQTYSMDNFDSIFDSRAPQHKPAEVIYTLSSAVSVLEGGHRSAEERDMRWEVQQQSRSNHGTNDIGSMLNLEQLVKQFRPFNVPPPPMPFNMAAEAVAKREAKQGRRNTQDTEAKQAASHKTYQTTVTINEATSSNGKKTFTASATPIVERRTSSRIAHQPFLRRMAQRQQQQTMEEPLERYEDGEQEGMMLISVKRQRKLKMKKHKYKKLMKRTRNLRRKLGKT